MSVWLLLPLILALVLLCWFFSPPGQRARQYMRQVSTSGYLSAPPSDRAIGLATLICAVVVFLWVGKVKVKGLENLDLAAVPLLLTPNHSHGGDPFVLPFVLRRRMRYMAGAGFMRVLGLLAGRMGAYSIDVTNRGGLAAIEASVQLLTSNQSICMFPEGELYWPPGPFKTGAVRIAAEASKRLGKPITIVPVFLRYGRYPGKWVHGMPDYARYTMPLFNPFWYRRGVTVVFGKPFSFTELPANPRLAAIELKRRVSQLDPDKPGSAR